MPFASFGRAAPLMVGALLMLAVASNAVAAQGARARVAIGVRAESYSFSDAAAVEIDRIALLTVPVAAVIPLGRRVELGITGAFARGEITRADGTDLMLSGMTDTEVRLTTAFAADRLRLGITAMLPTGQSQLTEEEMEVSGAIAADLLPFAISNWGSGGGLGVNAAFATPIGFDMAVALSAGYVVAREFEPISDQSFAYRPGNQMHLRAALDRSFGAGKASLQVIYQGFTEDKVGGDNLYQSGDRIQMVASYVFAAGARGNGMVYGGYLRRERGSYTSVALFTPAQDLIYVGAGLRLPLGGMQLLPAVDMRVLGKEDGVGQGNTITAGTGAEIPMGRVTLLPAVRARFGNLTVSEGIESTFTGLEIALSLRAGGGR